MRKVDIYDWEHIFLDTTIIFCYFHALRTPGNDPKSDFVKQLLDDLMFNRSRRENQRQFYMSAISISEMLDKSEEIPKTEKIIRDLRVQNMTYVSFDEEIAEYMTSNYHQILGTNKQKTLSKLFGFQDVNMVMVREWMTKDAMIIASSDFYDCDVVLTVDERTFFPLADAVGHFSALVKQEHFSINGSTIWAYNYPEHLTVQEPPITIVDNNRIANELPGVVNRGPF